MLLSEGEKPTNRRRSVDGRTLVVGTAPEGFSAQTLVSRAAASTPVGADAVLGSAPRTTGASQPLRLLLPMSRVAAVAGCCGGIAAAAAAAAFAAIAIGNDILSHFFFPTFYRI